MNKTDLLQLPDTQEVICTAKDLKDLVREVEEEYDLQCQIDGLNGVIEGIYLARENTEEETEKELDAAQKLLRSRRAKKKKLTERTPTNDRE